MGSGKKAEAARTSKKSKALERAAAEFADVATETDESGHVRKRDYSYTQNRELSWLMFDNRVMDEAFDPEVPLFEFKSACKQKLLRALSQVIKANGPCSVHPILQQSNKTA